MPRADGPFQVLQNINDNAYKLELLCEYGNISATFNISNLSLFNIGDEGTDSRTNPFDERGNDMNHQVDHNYAEGPLTIHGGLMIRVKAKRINETLTCLLEVIWNKQASQYLVKILWMQE